MIITLSNRADKYLQKLKKGDPKSAVKIRIFIDEILKNNQNPTFLPNCKKIENATDNRWRWRVGQYRVIGAINENGDFKILQIININKKNSKTYSHTKG